jgi:LmbE family N-acetylglucosaminyl deacetylase
MYKALLAFIITIFTFQISFSQAPKRATSADIHDAIKKLNVLGSALYLAAHPDDENTRLISYLSNHLRVNTAYLSITRGDGGQNLIGPEISELLGVIRTEELLMARSVDGGKQFFTRANDFGYSKNAEETLEIWNKNEVLSDVVWTIRNFQPDIIIDRFDHTSSGKTHGHHTSSAILSYEAFDLTGDKNAYPEQLKYVDTWQPKRLYFNTSWWFYGSQENFEKADKSKMVSMDVGVYYPLIGKSNNEIAAESRSMHKCQGMGSAGSRGSQMEYLELLKGEMPAKKEDLFEGINTTWTRLKGGAPIGKILKNVEDNFNYDNPSASVPELMKAYKLIKALPDEYWKKVKLNEITEVIKSCLALYVEAIADEYSATPGQNIGLSIEVTNRSAVDAKLELVSFLPMAVDSVLNIDLQNNQVFKFTKKINLPNDMESTSPYWLKKKGTLGMYAVEDQQLRGKPETPKEFKVAFKMKVDGDQFLFTVPVVYKKTDPVKGEVYRPFEITPPVFANIKDKVYVFANNEPKTVKVIVKAGKENVSGTVSVCIPESWRLEPETVSFSLEQKGEEQTFNFKLHPPAEQAEGLISAFVDVDSQTYWESLELIEYDHIPTQTVLQKSSSKIVKIDLRRAGQNIAYIEGAGDAIPESLEQIGYDVTLLDDHEITHENLKKFDAVIMGIRAYNTQNRLKYYQKTLMEYVKNGGTMIVQFNTSRRLVTNDLAPYSLKLSRDRVSMEDAEVRILNPDHEVLNFPNKITAKDFEGWVQERGLYFPDEWDEHFQAVLSSNDPGESPKDGGLLITKYGEGYYIYTGYSWFRELPAGVAGAYRIFTNMISIGKRP